MPLVVPGGVIRLDCADCLATWEVVHEPEVVKHPRLGDGMDAKNVAYCPGCGRRLVVP